MAPIAMRRGGSRITWIFAMVLGMSFQWTMSLFWPAMHSSELNWTGETHDAVMPEIPVQVPERELSTNSTADPSIQFVLTIGLEGTGHHLMRSLVENSPSRKSLRKLGIDSETAYTISTFLFQVKNENGLWNAHCNYTLHLNMTNIEHRVVSVLKMMQYLADTAREEGRIRQTPLRIPLNAVGYFPNNFGMQSFPSFRGQCRKLNYPSLDLYYHACQEAGVDCRHVYIYRDPKDVLFSTTMKRPFNENVLSATHLYKSMLHIISSEMATYRSKTLGCIAFYEGVDQWKDTVRQLWGYPNQTEYERMIAQVYKPPSKDRPEPKWTRDDVGPYMDVFQKAHETAIAVCESGPNRLPANRLQIT